MTQDALADLLALAGKATPGPCHPEDFDNWDYNDQAYLVACSPEVIAALVRVAMAADNGRREMVSDALFALDAALAKGTP